MITCLQVNLAEIFGPLELVQKVINPRDWVPILNSDLVLRQYKTSRSHPSFVPTQSSSHKVMSLA